MHLPVEMLVHSEQSAEGLETTKERQLDSDIRSNHNSLTVLTLYA